MMFDIPKVFQESKEGTTPATAGMPKRAEASAAEGKITTAWTRTTAEANNRPTRTTARAPTIAGTPSTAGSLGR